MKKTARIFIAPVLLTTVCLITLSNTAFADAKVDPLLTMVRIDQFETRLGQGDDPIVLEGEAWIGHDLHKLWLNADVEWSGDKAEEAEIDVLYGHSISPFWDARVGVRQSIRPDSRTWAVVGVKGLAPYFFNLDASLAATESGQVHANVTAEYEAMITQKLYIAPEINLNAYTQTQEKESVGSGVSDAQLGVRLVYEIRRELAPYIGVNQTQKFGKTKTFAKSSGETVNQTQFVMGVRAWF